MIMKNLIYIIALACLFGCRSYNEGLKTLIFEKETSNSVEPHISHILLNVPEKYIIGDISQIYEMGDKIIVLQSDTSHCGAYIFNKSGQFVAKVGNCGRANGEYLSADFVTIDGDKIVIFDQSRGYALRYSSVDYSFIDRQKIFNTIFYAPFDDYNICDNSETDASKPFSEYQYVMTDKEFNPIKGYVERYFISGYSSGPNVPMYTIDGEVRAYAQHNPIVYRFGSDGVSPIYKFQLEGLNFPNASYMQSISAGNKPYYKELKNSGYVSYYSIYESNNGIYLKVIANNNRYEGYYCKQSDKGLYCSKSDFWNDFTATTYCIGVIDDAFVFPVLIDELKEMDGYEERLSSEYDTVIRNAKSTDVVLTLCKFKL